MAQTKKITLTGIVQGVGFRPFVYRLAVKHNLSGYVKNVSGCVEILAKGADIDVFVRELLENPPQHAKIESVSIDGAPAFSGDGFTVHESGGDTAAQRFFSPDLAICKDCCDEILDASDRRFRHYFNNCTACGPRYSVLTAFPYDRKNTSMSKFTMCPDCESEYGETSDRRFHAETIACNHCGPRIFYRCGGETFEGGEAFDKAVQDLKNGGILAVKGIGGYHFACLPNDSTAVRRLRAEKGRDEKPFAVMFRDLAEIERVCAITDADAALLTSSARPIVLLHIKSHSFAPEVIFNNQRCGCFLPYTPLQELLMREIACLIMTSANVSSEPIIKNDAEMLSKWGNVLYHDREIMRGVEDSVAQTVCGKTQMIRRARGYVPLALNIGAGRNVLAMGGDLKAAFALSSGGFVTLSQFLGDLENVKTTEQYEKAVYDMMKLLDIKPELILCDAHPRYFSSRIAAKLAKQLNIPLKAIQHHHAHIASVMAEKNLQGKVIGVAFDGSGYGDDGNIWGGEFLICEDGKYRRAAHMEYTPLLGADAAAKNALQTADCFKYHCGMLTDEPLVKAALEHNVNTFLSSSAGRLFDAVAALSGVCCENAYEGQCAAALQYRAEQECRCGTANEKMVFTVDETDNMLIIRQNDIIEKSCSSNDGVALGFHIALAEMVLEVCRTIREKEGISQVALSGGVFQNSLLLELCVDRLSDNGFDVHFNTLVPPNDGGIALGQAYIGRFL